MAAHPDDPVELDALLGQPEIRRRLEESQRRFEGGETRTIPQAEFISVEDASGGTSGVRGRDWETRGGISIRGAHGGPDPNS